MGGVGGGFQGTKVQKAAFSPQEENTLRHPPKKKKKITPPAMDEDSDWARGTVKDVVSAQKSSGHCERRCFCPEELGHCERRCFCPEELGHCERRCFCPEEQSWGYTLALHTRQRNVFLEKTTTAQVQRVCVGVVGLVSAWNNRCCVKNPRKCWRGSDALQRKHAQNLPGLNGVGGCPGRIVPGDGVQQKRLWPEQWLARWE